MAAYCISYDLNRPTPDSADIEDVIKALGAWTKPLETVWFLSTSHSAEQIFDLVRRKIDATDRLLVVAIGTPHSWASWNLRPDVVTWMKENL